MEFSEFLFDLKMLSAERIYNRHFLTVTTKNENTFLADITHFHFVQLVNLRSQRSRPPFNQAHFSSCKTNAYAANLHVLQLIIVQIAEQQNKKLLSEKS